MRWEELYSKDPDVLVVAPCGFDMERTGKEMFWLTRRPRWKDLNAVRNRRVCITDGNQYFNRPGPRLVDSTEILAEMFFPGHVSFGREKTHWQVV
jgi:iron complex transport system substrate-binding protein